MGEFVHQVLKGERVAFEDEGLGVDDLMEEVGMLDVGLGAGEAGEGSMEAVWVDAEVGHLVAVAVGAGVGLGLEEESEIVLVDGGGELHNKFSKLINREEMGKDVIMRDG